MKKFREQYLECKENGNLIEVDIKDSLLVPYPMPAIPHAEHKNLIGAHMESLNVCVKYKKLCSSKVCYKDRKNMGK